MTALKSGDIDRFVADPDSAHPIVLVYGPDAGLVRERVDALVRASVDDTNDPFALARLDGEMLTANHARLVEEATTVPLFGGRRAVLVQVSARHNIAPAVEIAAKAPLRDVRVIIEAGDLKKTSPLRKLCESAKSAVALPCYMDGAKDIARLIDEEMRAANLTLAPDARAALAGLLGGDRLASRAELRKLALYAQGREHVELADVAAVVSDASDLALDGVIDAAFAGKTASTETEFAKARAGGATPSTILSTAIRQAAALHKIKLALDGGERLENAMRAARPPVHFTRQRDVEAALRIWPSSRLLRAMEQLADASLEARRQASLAETIAHRTLLALAVNARRQG